VSELAHEMCIITDAPDAVGNTMKAVTTGYAVGPAALDALLLFDNYTRTLSPYGITVLFDLRSFQVSVGLLVGSILPNIFASLAMQAVGRVGGQVVQEVRRQFPATSASACDMLKLALAWR
jgi:K(+)-stimulated pyrophosphate-energized sodium pump